MLQETADVVASIEAVAGLLGASRTEIEALVSEHPRYGPFEVLSSMHSRRACMSKARWLGCSSRKLSLLQLWCKAVPAWR